MYKLVAIDMDGTLLREDKTISEATFTAIKAARAQGVKVVLATGRPTNGIQRYLKELNMIEKGEYAVAFNGAVVQDIETGKIIAEKLMSFEDLKLLYPLSKELGTNIHILTPEICITPKHNKYSQLEADMNKIPVEIKDFNSLDPSTIIVKIMMIDEPEVLEAAIKKLDKKLYEKYTIVRSAPYFLEFLNKAVNKGVGVELLAKKLDIKREEIICIGDADNDSHMISYAGLGVAMGNAFEEVKKIADYITLTNEEDGVAHVFNKFVLNQGTA